MLPAVLFSVFALLTSGAGAQPAEPADESVALLRTLLEHQAEHRAKCQENIHVEYNFTNYIPHGMYSGVGADDGPSRDVGSGVRIHRGPLQYLKKKVKRVFERDGFTQIDDIAAVVHADYFAFSRVGYDGVFRIERVDHADPDHLPKRSRDMLKAFRAPGLFSMGYTNGLSEVSTLYASALRNPSFSMVAQRLPASESPGTHEIITKLDAPEKRSEARMIVDADHGYYIIKSHSEPDQSSTSTEYELTGLHEYAPGLWFPKRFKKQRFGRGAYEVNVYIDQVSVSDAYPESFFSMETLCEGHKHGFMKRTFLNGEVRRYQLLDGHWAPYEDPRDK